jgi:predicted acyl esterase
MQRGYTYVMVDLRGFGGSSGCLDWGGPGEQSDVQTAVEWAATQPWSTGHVGMTRCPWRPSPRAPIPRSRCPEPWARVQLTSS